MKLTITCKRCEALIEDTVINMKKNIKQYVYLAKGGKYEKFSGSFIIIPYVSDKNYYGKGIKCPLCGEIYWITEPDINTENMEIFK